MRTGHLALLAAGMMLLRAPAAPGRERRAHAQRTRPVFVTEARIATLRARIRNRVEPTAAAFRRVKSVADRELDREPHVLKEWYVPGYYRDAKGHAGAKRGLQDDANIVYQQALCYRMTGDEKYARAAVRIVHAWATQVESTSKKDDSTLSFSYHFPAMIFGADLLRVAESFSPESRLRFRTFLREKALPLNTMNARNNWGNWGLVLAMAIATYLDDQALFDRGVKRWKDFIDQQVSEDGHLHHEVKRSGGMRGIWYSHFSLMPQTIAAEIARVNGVDLYEYASPRGRTMRRAFDVLAGWTRRPETFPYYNDPKKLRGVTYYSYFEILNAHWPNADAAALLEQRRPMTASHCAPALTFTHGGLLRDGVVRATPKRRERAKPRKREPSAEKKKASPEVTAEWDAKLVARVKAELAAGREPRFHLGQMRQQVVSLNDEGTLSLKSRGIEMQIKWARLSIGDRKNLALACVGERDPSSHAIAAFYLLAAGDEREAEKHLAKAGAGAQAVRTAFE